MHQNFHMKKLTLILILFSSISLAQTNKPFSNPALFYGTNIGEYFQTLCRMHDIDEMIKFTAKESKDKFGIPALKTLYSQMEFSYKIKLKAEQQTSPNHYNMIYETTVMDTRGKLILEAVVENDSAKVVIKSLNKKNPFE